MPEIRHPRRGSMGFSPRKRARAETPHIKNWPEGNEKPKIQGFLGYKAGMTHAFVVDYRPTSSTSGREVRMPVSVVETPPLKVGAVRAYKETAYGLQTVGEIWADKLEPEILKRLTASKKEKKKKGDALKEGDMIDTIAVTKGKGFQGHVQRWGVKLLFHKNSKHRRMIGTAGSWHPSYIQATVPQAGQMGYHQRTEFNKRVLKIGEKGEEITPAGGFPNYGVIRNSYIILHGSIPGPIKRLISMRDAIRYQRGVKVEKPEITYISTTSKQGV
jgi:large subunit ribosomal protein L3